MAVTLHSFKNFPSTITPVPGVTVNPADIKAAITAQPDWNARKSNPAFIPNINNKVSVVIDGVINAIVPSDGYRTEQKDAWGKEFTQKRNWTIVAGIATVLVAGGAYISKPKPPMTLTMASVAGLIATVALGYRTWVASTEQAGWSINPVQVIAEKRSQAYREGFLFVKNNELRLDDRSATAAILPLEVNYLFKDYFDIKLLHLLSNDPTNDAQKKAWLDAFTSDNPVSQDVLKYAHKEPTPIPVQYQKVSHDYEVLHAQLKEIRRYYEGLRTQALTEKNQTLGQIENNRRLLMITPDLILANYTSAAQKKRDKLLRNKHSDKAKINKDYNRKIVQYHDNYRAAVTVIDLALQPRIDAAHRKLEQDLQSIKVNEDSAHAPYYNYARGLLEYAKQMQQDVKYSTEIPKFSPPHVAATAPRYEDIKSDDIQDETLRVWFKQPSAPPLEDLGD